MRVVGDPASPRTVDEEEEERRESRRSRGVYVVHADGGDGDVHIQLPEGRAKVSGIRKY